LARRQELGENSVLGGRIGGSAEAHHCVGQQRVHREQHQHAPDNLDRVGDQHHPALGHRIGESTDDRRKDHVRDDKGLLQRRQHPFRFPQFLKEPDGGDQQRVVGERAEELRRHDRVKTGLHFLWWRLHMRGSVSMDFRNRGARGMVGYNVRNSAARVLYHVCPVHFSRGASVAKLR